MLKAFSVAMAVVAVPGMQPASTAPASRVEPVELVVFRDDPVLRMTVPVSVNGRRQRFIVDTAATRSGVSNELAASLGLPIDGRTEVVGFAGARSVPTVRVSHIRFGKSAKRNVSALSLARVAIGADGFLGTDTLRGKSVFFDFTRNEMGIHSAATPARSMLAPTTNGVARLRTKSGQLVFTDVRASGVRVQAILDTGSSLSVGNEALRRALLARKKIIHTEPVRILAVTGEMTRADYAMVRDVVIGNTRIRRMAVAFVAEPFANLGMSDEPAMLLGMDALRTFNEVAIDFRSNTVRFRGSDKIPFWSLS